MAKADSITKISPPCKKGSCSYDVVVIGAGAAGMAAALELSQQGKKTALIDREDHFSGILFQCIHSGFGVHEFKEELTGPEYAEKYISLIKASDIDTYLNTTVIAATAGMKQSAGESDNGARIGKDGATINGRKTVIAYSAHYGVLELECSAIVLAMGCRERNRGNIGIAGTRPSGIFTAGFAQRLINIDGYVPGKSAVIIGSGDIGLIMARRLTWVGVKVHAVVEILPYPSGLSRNISQCLNDFGIPLYLSHVVTKIRGKDRVEGVDIAPISQGAPDMAKGFSITCDTILLSIGLIPENELSKKMGVEINQNTGGPFVDAAFMTNVDGIFACGNVLHVHDLVDYVSEEAKKCARFVRAYLDNQQREITQGNMTPGANLIYVVPNKYALDRENVFYMRPLILKNNAVLTLSCKEKVLATKKLLHVQPSEMIQFRVKEDIINSSSIEKDAVLEISLK